MFTEIQKTDNVKTQVKRIPRPDAEEALDYMKLIMIFGITASIMLFFRRG